MDIRNKRTSNNWTPAKTENKYFRCLIGVWLVEALIDGNDWLHLLLLKSVAPDVKLKQTFYER